MKKILLLAACAAVMSLGAQAETTYTLTQQWMNQNVAVAAASAWGPSARQAAAANGTIYVQDATWGYITPYTKDGAGTTIPTGHGWGITTDESGNLVVSTITAGGNPYRTDTTQLKLISADGKTVKEITPLATMPALRADYFGQVAGNVFGESATQLLGFNTAANITALQYANGALTSVKDVAVTGAALPAFATQCAIDYGYYDEAADAEHYLLTVRNNTYLNIALSYGNDGTPSGAVATKIKFVNDTTIAATKPASVPANAGGAMFQLGGDTYLATPAVEDGFNYRNPITIYKLDDDSIATAVATTPLVFDAEKVKGAGNWAIPEVVDETTANIYQYYLGGFVAEYTFKVTKTQTGVNDVNATKTVAGVHYVNLAGQVSAQPFEGVNIKVVSYTDGSKKAVKVIK